jgi:hypothetical protein
MRAMRRWLLRIFTVLSLLVCLCASALWVQSYRAPTEYERIQCWPQTARAEVLQWLSFYGVCDLSWSWQAYIDPPQSVRDALNTPIETRWLPQDGNRGFITKAPWWMRLGFDWQNIHLETHTQSNDHIPFVIRNHLLSIAAPYWAIEILAAILPVSALLRWRRRRRRANRLKQGLCAACGYNLRGNVSGVCPECGQRRLESTT